MAKSKTATKPATKLQDPNDTMLALWRKELEGRAVRVGRAKKAALNELESWIDSLNAADFAETHHITDKEAEEAIELLQKIVDNAFES